MGNLPPFYVGQKVVAISTCSSGYRKKGAVYTVSNLEQCPCCKLWYVDIGEKGRFGLTRCFMCGYISSEKTVTEWHAARAFVPVDETFQPIELEEILKTETPLICVN